jgi:hypothetical protein
LFCPTHYAASWRYNHNKHIQYDDNRDSFLPEAVNVKGQMIVSPSAATMLRKTPQQTARVVASFARAAQWTPMSS